MSGKNPPESASRLHFEEIVRWRPELTEAQINVALQRGMDGSYLDGTIQADWLEWERMHSPARVVRVLPHAEQPTGHAPVTQKATRYHPNHPYIDGRDVVLACDHEALEARVAGLIRDRDYCLQAREHYAGLYGQAHARIGELEQLLRDTTAVAITMLFNSYAADTKAAFTHAELEAVITACKHLQDSRVEHVYRRAWNAVMPTPAAKTQEAPAHG